MIRATNKILLPADRLAALLTSHGLTYQREVIFHPSRKWRADFLLTGSRGQRLMVEVEGGTFATSRHTTGAGFERGAEKYAEAQCLGFIVLRVTPRQIDAGLAYSWIKKLLD